MPPKLLVGRPATLTVSARAVDPSGRMLAIYTNVRQPKLVTTTSIRESDISVLYRVGSFEGNFLRSLAMILAQLMFIAALGIFAGSFLGFAVSSLLVLLALVTLVAKRLVEWKFREEAVAAKVEAR